MKNQSIRVLGPVLLAMGVAAVGWQQLLRGRKARIEHSQIVATTATLDRSIEKLEERLRFAEENQTPIKAELNALEKRSPAETSKPVAGKKRPSLSLLETIRNEPDAEFFFLESTRSDLAASYGPLMRTLGLSPEAVKKFNQIYVQRAEIRMDLDDVIRSKGEAESGAAVAQLRAAADTDYEKQQHALLGDAGFQQLQDYERTFAARTMVSAVAGVAALEHAPISAAQADALVRAAAEESESYRKGGSAHYDVDWARFETRARALLTPEQFLIMTTMDPGPSRGGFLQTKMYTLAHQASQREAEPITTSSSEGVTAR